jgi:hypothetical protein
MTTLPFRSFWALPHCVSGACAGSTWSFWRQSFTNQGRSSRDIEWFTSCFPDNALSKSHWLWFSHWVSR